MSNYVFLIDQNKTPLMPVHPAKAREFLGKGKAAVFRRFPFTLILKREISEPVIYPLTLKIDPGSKVTGFALVTDRGEVVWRMQLQHRGGLIKKKLEQRRNLRRQRRSRLRYRQPRFLNRTRPKGWLPPSLMHRVLTTETWVKRIIKFCPVAEIWIERVKFDTQLMQNPDISGVEYQQGALQGYTVREYLLEKWGRQCTYCKKENIPLQIEHIQPKSKGGSNRVSNLCLACEKCNQRKSDKPVEQFLKRKPDLLASIKRKAKQPLRDTSAVNATRFKIVEVMSIHGTVKTATGAQTKMNRVNLGLPKGHDIDAACVGDTPNLVFLSDRPLMVTATGAGGRQRCQTDKYGYPQKHRPLRPIHGYQTGDVVQVDIPKGKNKGQWTARLCPYSNGDCEIYPKGRKRLGTKLSYITKFVHRKDGYKYA